MDKLLAWKKFISTGSVDNYISYCRIKQQQDGGFNAENNIKSNLNLKPNNALKN